MENVSKYSFVYATTGNEWQQPSDNSWKPPLPNHFRLDVDVGFDNIRNRLSVGVVVRDAQGLVCGAQACSIRHPGLLQVRSLFQFVVV